MSTRSGWILLALAVALAFFSSGYAKADNLYASIRGTVEDQSGAVVPSVKLTATNVATGINYATVSGKDGAYAFLQLPIGNYSVKAEASGFKTFQVTSIHLDLNQVIYQAKPVPPR